MFKKFSVLQEIKKYKTSQLLYVTRFMKTIPNHRSTVSINTILLNKAGLTQAKAGYTTVITTLKREFPQSSPGAN